MPGPRDVVLGPRAREKIDVLSSQIHYIGDMNWWAVFWAVLSGVAAAFVDDGRPKARAAKKKAPPEPSASAPKKDPGVAPNPGAAPSPAEAPRPAGTPLQVEVPREGVASALPLIVVGQPANLGSSPERKAGESRRKRRSRAEDKAAETTQTSRLVAHTCPHCGHAIAPELAPLSVEPTNTPATEPACDGAAASEEPAVAVSESVLSDEGANDDDSQELDRSGAYETPGGSCSAARATPEPTPTPKRGSRVGSKGERLTLRLATRQVLSKLR